MDRQDILEQIEQFEKEIAALPSGSVSAKKINGKTYYYHRYMQDGRRVETYVAFEKADELRALIDRRKKLKAQIRQLKKSLPAEKKTKSKEKADYEFRTYVRTGDQLKDWAFPARNFVHRECYSALRAYVFGERQDKVFILFGLRRTGKTTMIRQAVLDMTPEQQTKTAYIQLKTADTLSDVNTDLKYLESRGFSYVFLDEVTLLEDFIEGAALFSDIYAASGMKIVLSGTDSLGFLFTETDQLYDRCILLHTTFIPYREFENVLCIRGIDEYIRYGGTMSMGGVHYNEASSFATKKKADEYINSAIAKNIQHSLRFYQDGGHFRGLYDLYEKGELTSAINRVVEDINHRFTKDVLTRTFRSHDLSAAARNLLKDKKAPLDLYETIDRDFVERSVKTMLEILDKEEQTLEIDESCAFQIKEYLSMLDLITEIKRVHLPAGTGEDSKTVFVQPGIRYAVAEALIDSLLQDQKFDTLSAEERRGVLERVLDTVRGYMMEDIVLLETKLAKPRFDVFQVQFAAGEFDMVVHDPKSLTCSIYEIKHSRQAVPQQCVHLKNEDYCAMTSHRFGRITGRYVIYRGDETVSDGIRYLNVEEYLKDLSK